MHIWVLAEARDGQVKRISYELVTAARALDDSADVTAVLVGSGVGPLAGDLASDRPSGSSLSRSLSATA